MKMILSMYVTLLPTILSGILNMIWCKLPILKSLRRPLDGGKTLRDGQRVFGDNKTWKGLVGYLLLNCVTAVLWGLLCRHTAVGAYNFFYVHHENTFGYNLLIGLLLGLAYALFELPNSFLKRRLGIAPGKPPAGAVKVLFIFLDQADSIFGCLLVVCLFYPMSVAAYFGFVLLGALTHIVINILLYCLKLRKNMF